MSDAGRNQKRFWFHGLWTRQNDQDTRTRYADIDEENPWFALQDRRQEAVAGERMASEPANRSARWLADDSSPLGFSDDDGTLKQLDHPVWRQAFGTKRKANRFIPRDRQATRWQPASGKPQSSAPMDRGSTWLMQTVAAAVLVAGGIYAQHVQTPLAGQVDSIYQSAFTKDDAPHILPSVDAFLSAHHIALPASFGLTTSISLHAPVTGPVIANFSVKHPELTYQAASGAKVYAAGSGTVTAVDISTGKVIIDHGSIGETTYQKLATIAVKQGEFVTSGQVIGHLQKTAAPTLVFAMEQGGKAVDPATYLNGSKTGI